MSSGRADDGLDARMVVRRNGFALDVALSAAPGQTVALVGPNGAGKSTTMSALAGLVRIDEGTSVVNGRPLTDVDHGIDVPPEGRRIGVVFQDYLLFAHLSALDNVAFGLRARGDSRNQARSAAARWLDQLGVADLADRRPGELSGGQAQRIAVARALATEPDLLLLDEPLAALDVGTRAALRRTLQHRLAELEIPAILVTHDPTDAFLLADTIVVLENGHVVQSGTVEQIRRRPASAYVAALAGTNLLFGSAEQGEVTVTGVGERLHTDDTTAAGSVIVIIHPRAIALHTDEPHGSPRNTWSTPITHMETLGDIVRVELGAPFALTADITPAAAHALDLRPGREVWAAVKATEVTIAPA